MKTADLDLLIVPGLAGSGPDHWQSRWEAKLSTARRVEQADWDRPMKDDWARRIAEDVLSASRPVAIIAHSLGVYAVAHAAPLFAGADVRTAFLVAPPAERAVAGYDNIDPAFLPVPRAPLPFPSVTVLSRTDPYATFEEGEELALDWGSAVVDAGDSGHINTDSGHGPWPEGLMRLAGLFKTLS